MSVINNNNGKTPPVEIEKNVPMPIGRPTGFTAILRAMEIGDSFVYPKAKRNYLGGFAKHAGVKLTSRAISDTQIRVWRVE